jgi:hypothetical protein
MMYYFKAEDGRTHYSRFYTNIVKKALEFNVNPQDIKFATQLITEGEHEEY